MQPSGVRPQDMCNYLKLYFAGVTRLKGREGRRGGKRRKGEHDVDKCAQGIFQQSLIRRSDVNGPHESLSLGQDCILAKILHTNTILYTFLCIFVL